MPTLIRPWSRSKSRQLPCADVVASLGVLAPLPRIDQSFASGSAVIATISSLHAVSRKRIVSGFIATPAHSCVPLSLPPDDRCGRSGGTIPSRWRPASNGMESCHGGVMHHAPEEEVWNEQVRAFCDLRESLKFSIAWICDSRCGLVKDASLHDATSLEWFASPGDDGGGGWRHVSTESGKALRHRAVGGDQVGPCLASKGAAIGREREAATGARNGSGHEARRFWLQHRDRQRKV